MKRVVFILISGLVLLSSCNWKFKTKSQLKPSTEITVKRFDRLESRYLTTADYAALQEMHTDYPVETRTLVEKVLQIGSISDSDVRFRFLQLYEDTAAQLLIEQVEAEFADMQAEERLLNKSFKALRQWFPDMPQPEVYAQIGLLKQSIVVAGDMIGISLDKYLGADFPLYANLYTAEQRRSMSREYIVPDCLCFYLLSLYPLEGAEQRSQQERDDYMGRIMWVANKAMGKHFFKSESVAKVARTMNHDKSLKISDLLVSE